MKKLNVLVAGLAMVALASCGGTGTGSVKMNDVKDTISYSIGMGRAVRVYRDQLPYDIILRTRQVLHMLLVLRLVARR